MQGKVKWFNYTKGYGFIVSSEQKRDVFVHISAVESSGIKNLNEGQSLNFDLEERNGKVAAINLQLV